MVVMKYKLIEQLLSSNFSVEIVDRIWSYLLPVKVKHNFDNLRVISPYEIRKVSRKYHLTIKDILELPVGETVTIFCMDRNLFDFCICEERIGKIIPAERFFAYGYIMEYVRTNGIIGTWKFLIFDDSPKESEFDLDLDLGELWYPLYNNRIPIVDSQEHFRIPDDFVGKHYEELPESTRVGWRGPCMLLKDVKKLPKILMTEF